MRNLYALITAVLLATVLIGWASRQQEKRFEELALGEETTSYFARVHAGPVHISALSGLKDAVADPAKKTILFLGNSQTHAINQMGAGQVNYVQMMADTIQDKNVLAITMPNVSLQEMALSFDYTVHQKPIQYMVLPVFMDDLREDGIRQDISFDTLRLTGYRIEGDTLAFPVIRKINQDLHSAKPAEQSNKDIAGLSKTTQERVELWLNHQLEEYSTAWKNRPRLRGEFFTLLYSLRNTALGINAQTKRKMIPQRYNNNFEALKYILSTSEKRGIAVLLYIPPIRQDVEVPYSTEEYANFKKDVVALCSAHPRTVTFLNLETIVPGEYWGVKSATTLGAKPELDFMHFQYEGHRMLFQHLYPPVLRMTRS